MHLRTQVSCEVLQMIKMRACCTWKRQDQSVAEVANETAKPERSGLERPCCLRPYHSRTSERSTNLRLCEIVAGRAPLFPVVIYNG